MKNKKKFYTIFFCKVIRLETNKLIDYERGTLHVVTLFKLQYHLKYIMYLIS